MRRTSGIPLAALASGALLLGAAAVGVLRSVPSTVSVYNHTGARLPAVRVAGGGRSAVSTGLDDGDSWRWRMPSGGAPGAVELTVAGDPPRTHRGPEIAPASGYRVSVRLWPDDVAEWDVQRSIWFRWQDDASSAPSVSEPPPPAQSDQR